ncbi:MAG: HNH endonuclease [Elusimicrobia bacterium]|nr:HNH endonuclease [Elusimicrobiota bacterium]
MHEPLAAWTDEELAASLETLAASERLELVRILRHLAEFNRRRLAITKGYPSLFAYCVKRLGFSEGEAMRRILSFRAATRFPVIYRLLERGQLTATTVSMLEPHLTRPNYHELIKRSAGKSKREVERLIAELAPETPPPDRIRVIVAEMQNPEGCPVPLKGGTGSCATEDLFAPNIAPALEGAPKPAPEGHPPLPRRAVFTFSAEESLLRSLERARDLLRHKHPAGRLEEIFTEALDALLENIDPRRRLVRKTARMMRAREATGRKTIPRKIKDEVWKRDGGVCSFVGADRVRCAATAFLEYDHILPRAHGGRSNDSANIRLLCRNHNQSKARRVLGDSLMDAATARRIGGTS